MKGLLIKEFYSASYLKKSILLMIGIALVLGLFLDMGYSFLSTYLMLFMMMNMQSLFRFDEDARWDVYGVCLPVSRKKIVAARYLFLLIMMVAAAALGMVLSLVVALIQNAPAGWHVEMLVTMVIMACLFLLALSVSSPISYRFGSEKSRIVTLATFLVPLLLFVLLMPYVGPLLDNLRPEHMLWVGLGGLLLAVAAYFISFAVSCKIYRKREF